MLGADDGDIIDMEYDDIASGRKMASGVTRQAGAVGGKRSQRQYDTGEVTYEVFERDFYGKVWRKAFPEKPNASQQNFQPMLIWNEITSFIKGL